MFGGGGALSFMIVCEGSQFDSGYFLFLSIFHLGLPLGYGVSVSFIITHLYRYFRLCTSVDMFGVVGLFSRRLSMQHVRRTFGVEGYFESRLL